MCIGFIYRILIGNTEMEFYEYLATDPFPSFYEGGITTYSTSVECYF